MKYLLLSLGICTSYILAQCITVKVWEHKPSDWSGCAIIIAMTAVLQCGINLALGETVMTPALFGSIVVGCFFGQVIISEFTEGEHER